MKNKTDLRPDLDLPEKHGITPEEHFQNDVLRPVLKLQNELYVLTVEQYVIKQHKDSNFATPEQKRNFIARILQKDAVLKNTLLGMTLGMLTAEELKTYLLNPGNYNRRISAMITERLLGQI